MRSGRVSADPRARAAAPVRELRVKGAPIWATNVISFGCCSGYLYISFTNAVAFSPADAMPLTRRVKMMMLAESAEGQLFYLMSHGIREDESLKLIVNGVLEPIIKERPVHDTVEMNA